MLKARVLTALVLLFALLAVLFFAPSWGWMFFLCLISFGAGWEWAGLMHGHGVGPGRRWGLGLGFALATAMAGAAEGLTIARGGAIGLILGGSCLFWVVVVPIWLKRKWRLPLGGAGYLLGCLVCVPAILALSIIRTEGPLLLLAVLAAVWLADIAAYFAGRRFGQRKLAPAISPGKSWEGVMGALLSVGIYSLALSGVLGLELSSLFRVVGVVLAGFVFVALSVEGDLFESLLKRQAGLKDSGSILPGHGGILDRVDSLTSTLPLVALVILLYK